MVKGAWAAASERARSPARKQNGASYRCRFWIGPRDSKGFCRIRSFISEGEYEATGAKLGGDAWICGRKTMQQHFAEDDPFVSASNTPAAPQPVFTARRADSYVNCVDTLGKLRWSSGDLDGDHLVCVLSERAPADYLTMLREKGISYVVVGESSVDLAEAVGQLGEHFGVRTLLLEGGGHINGAFLQLRLLMPSNRSVSLSGPSG